MAKQALKPRWEDLVSESDLQILGGSELLTYFVAQLKFKSILGTVEYFLL